MLVIRGGLGVRCGVAPQYKSAQTYEPAINSNTGVRDAVARNASTGEPAGHLEETLNLGLEAIEERLDDFGLVGVGKLANDQRFSAGRRGATRRGRPRAHCEPMLSRLAQQPAIAGP